MSFFDSIVFNTSMNIHAKSASCCMGLSFLVFILFLGTYLSNIVNLNYITEHECNITQVLYPTHFPTPSNTDNWDACDCGRRCESWSPCISLYSDLYPDMMIKHEIGDTLACTFHNDECRDGENYQIIEGYLVESDDIYKTYINSTQTCYYNSYKNEVYLSIDLNWDAIITIFVFMGLTFTLSMIFLVFYSRHKYNKKKPKVVLEHI